MFSKLYIVSKLVHCLGNYMFAVRRNGIRNDCFTFGPRRRTKSERWRRLWIWGGSSWILQPNNPCHCCCTEHNHSVLERLWQMDSVCIWDTLLVQIISNTVNNFDDFFILAGIFLSIRKTSTAYLSVQFEFPPSGTVLRQQKLYDGSF